MMNCHGEKYVMRRFRTTGTTYIIYYFRYDLLANQVSFVISQICEFSLCNES